ncbi:hypothetical protein DQ04_07371000 [Trypanosoma grayi]|uniref:hypothetical protein n=1 Tax=Trypanosoma grayi TaxID=71804 RepID=UPI0004F4A54A|nr:hypothetical protein DQ04_07371000 [Trypanosoma grayi]KEG08360.1 hypothetical protein DQ04_07371000 [Trypanosoma grayi]
MSVPTDELLRTFDLYDRESVGSIPVESVVHVLRSCGMFCSDKDVAELLHELFPTHDSVTRSEFMAIVKKKNTLKPADFRTVEDVVMAFNAFDTHDAGALASDEVLSILTRMDEKIGIDAYHDVMADFKLNEADMAEIKPLAAHIMRPVKEHKLTPTQTLQELER